jgi:hypothetical protein
LKTIFKYLVYSNIWIAIGASCLSLNTYLLANKSPNVELILLVFFATLFTYNFQRILKLLFKINLHGERVKWIEKNQIIIYILIILSAIVTTILSVTYLSKIWLVLLFSGIITVFYVVKIPGLNGKNLRDIPGIKIYTIALVWGLTSVIIPNLIDNLFDLTLTVALFISNFIFILAITIPFDIRDINLDDSSKKTIPQLIGVKKSTYLSIILLLISQVLLAIYWSKMTLAFVILTLILTPILLKSNENKPELYFSGLVDSSLLIYSLIIYLIFNAS